LIFVKRKVSDFPNTKMSCHIEIKLAGETSRIFGRRRRAVNTLWIVRSERERDFLIVQFGLIPFEGKNSQLEN
jgi:hypothetical protein